MTADEILKRILERIYSLAKHELRFMEICGTHTRAVSDAGLRDVLPAGIQLLSGPGCPVCVTDEGSIDAAIDFLRKQDVILACFGDMLRVRGTHQSLMEQSDKRHSVQVLYSPLEVVELALQNPLRQVVFFAVGFETTAPLIALAVKSAYEQGIGNLSFLTSLKLMPPILERILGQGPQKIHGIICPGHVATVTGSDYFRFITEDFHIPAVVCGFEAMDIVMGLLELVRQNAVGTAEFKNLYKTCVNRDGNQKALGLVQEVFQIGDALWRGIGRINASGLLLKDEYACLDTLKRYSIQTDLSFKNQTCSCSDVLMGNILPDQCPLFGRGCSPDNPKGPCMVSSEGSCAAYYRNRECDF